MPMSTEIFVRVRSGEEGVTFVNEEFRKSPSVTFSQGELLIRNNGRLWTLGCLSEVLPDDFCKKPTGDTNLIARVTSFVEACSFTVCGEVLVPNRKFLMSMRGAILHGLYFPSHTKFQHRDNVWLRKLLRVAPSVQIGPLRFDVTKFKRDSFTVIPRNAIPNVADRNINIALQELCYLASVGNIADCNLMLRNRFERIGSVVAYLYASADFFASRRDSILDWIDSRVNEIMQNYDEEPKMQEPLVLLFQGSAGAGKTTKVQQICEYLGIPHSEVYCRQDAKHWDGYKGQLVTLFDDLFQGAHSSKLSEFVNVVNSRSMPIPMANLVQKTVCFTSPIVIVTANELTIPSSVNAGAVARRINHAYVVKHGNTYNAKISVEKNHLKIDSRGAPVAFSNILNKISEFCYGEALPVFSRNTAQVKVNTQVVVELEEAAQTLESTNNTVKMLDAGPSCLPPMSSASITNEKNRELVAGMIATEDNFDRLLNLKTELEKKFEVVEYQDDFVCFRSASGGTFCTMLDYPDYSEESFINVQSDCANLLQYEMLDFYVPMAQVGAYSIENVDHDEVYANKWRTSRRASYEVHECLLEMGISNKRNHIRRHFYHLLRVKDPLDHLVELMSDTRCRIVPKHLRTEYAAAMRAPEKRRKMLALAKNVHHWNLRVRV